MSMTIELGFVTSSNGSHRWMRVDAILPRIALAPGLVMMVADQNLRDNVASIRAVEGSIHD